MGGDNSLLVPLCYSCHRKVHGLPENGLDHRELIKIGQRKSTKRYDKVCEQCGEAFVSKRSDRMFCKDACRVKASRQRTKQPLAVRNCDQCGVEYQPKRKTSVFCSAKCRVKYNRSLRAAVR